MNIEILDNFDTAEKELYLFGEFQASWDSGVDILKVIVPYAIDRAVRIGEKRKAQEIRRVLEI
jgi:predicted metal-binding protein